MKMTKRILAAMLMLAMAFMLTACGSDLKGAWKLTGGTALSEALGMEGMDLAAMGIDIMFKFNDDDEFVVEMSAMGVSETVTGTWEEDGDSVTMTVEGEPLTCTWDIDGDVLTLTVSEGDASGSMVFEKAD